jgi:hypothetical protein
MRHACIYRKLLLTLTSPKAAPTIFQKSPVRTPLNRLVKTFSLNANTSYKFLIMNKALIVLALFSLSVIGITSCTAQHGCKGTQGYVGYGSR